MVHTKAAEALRWAVDPSNPQRRMSQSALARVLDVSQPSVSEWVRMNTRPESHLRKAIERILGIPENDWMTDDERELVARAVPAESGTVPSKPGLAGADDTGERPAVKSKPTGSEG